MVFLIQIAQRHCVGEQLVERISAGAPHVLTKSDRHRIDRSEFVDDVVSPALPIPAFSDSLQSHCALSNERIPRATRAGRRHCRNVARIRQPQRGCFDGYQFTAKQFSDPRSLARSGVAHVEKLGKLTAVKAELDASVVVNTGGASDRFGSRSQSQERGFEHCEANAHSWEYHAVRQRHQTRRRGRAEVESKRRLQRKEPWGLWKEGGVSAC